MKAVPALANLAWLGASLPAWRLFRAGLLRPREAQSQILRRLLADNSGSVYGRQYRFGEIRGYEQFRDRVPVVDYDNVEPWIMRSMRGDEAMLTRDPVTRLVPTSGSTGARKLIPYTEALQCEFNAAIGPWLVDINATSPAISLGPSYWSISPAIPTATVKSVVPIGFDDDSACLGGVRQRLVEATFAAPSAIRLAHDVEAFRYLTLLCLLRQPGLRFISIWHPSFLTLLLGAMSTWRDELLRDIATGDCPRAVPMPSKLRDAMWSKPQPRRADELRSADPRDLRALWPQLRLVSCWGDGQAALPMADLRRSMRGIEVQPKGLLATEAFVSIPFQGLHPVAVTSHFFEFEDRQGAIHLTDELRRGETYTVIVTTGGGLWRYRLGDIVEVDGWLGATPSLRFLGRGASVSDLCGEKLTEAFVTIAIQNACAGASFAPRFAMLAPEQDAAGHWNYTLFVEGAPPCEFAERIETELRNNPHYALCRDLHQLDPLRCFEIPCDAYETCCRAAVANGRRLGDVKPEHLSSRTDWGRRFGRVPAG